MLTEANHLLRSAHAIASREGEDTNWEAFKNSLEKELIKQAGAEPPVDEQTLLRCTVTARTYRQPPEPDDYVDPEPWKRIFHAFLIILALTVAYRVFS